MFSTSFLVCSAPKSWVKYTTLLLSIQKDNYETVGSAIQTCLKSNEIFATVNVQQSFEIIQDGRNNLHLSRVEI